MFDTETVPNPKTHTHTLMTCIFSMFRVAASLVCTRTVNVQPEGGKQQVKVKAKQPQNPLD